MSDDFQSGKRTRASGEVLDYLLQEFDQNHNPSPEQRKEISDKTNMTEKAVRIWFQNRRAKVRKNERLGRSTSSNPGSINSRSNSLIRDSNGGSSSGGSGFKNYDYPKNFDINEKYCFIECSSLSVGSWQRVKSGFFNEINLKNDLINLSPFTLIKVMENVDLLVILLKKNLEINYFFSAISNNSKILFRIFYPLTNILTCSLLDNNIDKENNELRVSLSHQPKFSVNFYNGENQSSNQWSICDDFSEGQQVSSAHSDGGTSIPHVLVGKKSSICALNDFILEKIQQHHSDYMINHNHSSGNNHNNNNNNNNNYSLVNSTNNSDDDMLDGDFDDDNNLLNLNDNGHLLNDRNLNLNLNNNGNDIHNSNNNNNSNGNSNGNNSNSNNNNNNFNNDNDRNNNDDNDDLKLDNGAHIRGESIWSEPNDLNNGLSPIGQFGSDTSPTSLGSDKNQRKNQELQPNFHYNEMFSANTPDFLSSSHTPNIVQMSHENNVVGVDVNVDDEPTPSRIVNNDYEGISQDQFDFPVVNEYSGQDRSVNSPNGHVDNFIDYNNNYP